VLVLVAKNEERRAKGEGVRAKSKERRSKEQRDKDGGWTMEASAAIRSPLRKEPLTPNPSLFTFRIVFVLVASAQLSIRRCYRFN